MICECNLVHLGHILSSKIIEHESFDVIYEDANDGIDLFSETTTGDLAIPKFSWVEVKILQG